MERASDFGAFELNRIHIPLKRSALSPSSYLLSFCALRNCRFRVALLPSFPSSLRSTQVRVVPFISIFACKSITSTSFKISPHSVPLSPRPPPRPKRTTLFIHANFPNVDVGRPLDFFTPFVDGRPIELQKGVVRTKFYYET